jgi:hypothetical protein
MEYRIKAEKYAKQPKKETNQSDKLQKTLKQGSTWRQILGYTPKTICMNDTKSTTQRYITRGTINSHHGQKSLIWILENKAMLSTQL